MDLAAIGELLQRARREQGLTLEACSAATKIRERYLRALEAGEADVLPADVYLRGFLRNYADYLGLDGPALVAAYAAHLEAVREAADRAAGRPSTRPGRERGQPHRPPALPAEVGPPASAGRRSPRGVPARGWSGRSPLLALFLVVVVVAAGAVAWSAYRAAQPAPAAGGDAAPEPAATPGGTTEPPAEPEAPDAGTEPAQAPPPVTVSRTDPDAATIRLEVSARPLTVLLEARWGRCWVHVVADGTYLFEGTLEVGESRLVEAVREVRVILGNPGGLSVTVNGVNLGALAELGPKTVLIVASGP